LSQTSSTQKPVILLLSNSAWNLVNFRTPIIEALKCEGYRLVAAVSSDQSDGELRTMGVDVRHIPVDARGLSPLRDARLLARYLRLFREIQPAAILPFTAKPNIYGSLAAASLKVPVINTITGLGTGFLKGAALAATLRILYRLALRRSARVFVHNPDDRELLLSRRIVTAEQARVVPGSGVDTERFILAPGSRPRKTHGPLTFLFIGRLLKTKGAFEFVAAADELKDELDARFQMLGRFEAPPDALTPEMLQPLVNRGVLEVLGEVSDVRPIIGQADCVVLPSYREGMPRAILEASAMGKPVIATDAPGCRQAVEGGITGLLCEVGSAASLANAMRRMAVLTGAERAEMGLRGRQKIQSEFSQELVARAYLKAVSEAGLTANAS
jgi:glycosyltransferase involved in cell wall biosynthesis